MSSKWISNLSDLERIELAREKMSPLIDLIIDIVSLHESNRVIVYSDRLSKQIPSSYAAHAFNLFQWSSHAYELIRLCALWDKPAVNRESIPTVAALIDSPTIIASLAASIADDWPDDPTWAAARSQWAAHNLQRSVCAVRSVVRSERLKNLTNHRDKNLAHALSQSVAERRGQVFALPKFGDERKLLRLSINIADRLYSGVSNTSFSFDGTRLIARKNAEALWHSCQFDIHS